MPGRLFRHVASPQSSVLVYLGLGSNLGDRAANLSEALRRLGALPATHVLQLSPVYETEPVGPIPQGWFLNAVVAVETALRPLELLRAAKEIERDMGREPGPRWGPRLIDIDILLYGSEQLAGDELTLPHPELWNRRFALVPLRELLSSGPLATRVDRRLAELGDNPTVRPYSPLI